MAEQELKSLTKELIERILDNLECVHMRSKQGNILAKYSSNEIDNFIINFWLFIEGNDNDTLRILLCLEEDLPQSRWLQLLQICNEFHETTYYGRAYLRTSKDNLTADVCFESSIRIAHGITENQLESFINDNLDCADKFLKILRDAINEAKNLPLQLSQIHRQPITKERIEHILSSMDIASERTEDDRVFANMMRKREDGYSLFAIYDIEGDNNERTKTFISVSEVVPKSKMGLSFFLANKFNGDGKIWLGRAHLIIEDDSADGKTHLNYVSTIHFPIGATDEHLKNEIRQQLGEAITLFNMASEEEMFIQ